MRIIQPGMLTTVQDLGRAGFGSMGVPVGGAADAMSLRIGNRLVGNEDGAPGLEMTLTGAVVEFDREMVVAVTGGECACVVESGVGRRGLPQWEGVVVGAGERVRIGPIMRGVRAYLCVGEGVSVARVMGSAATHVGAGFGGFAGRALRTGDVVECGGGTRARVAGAGSRELWREWMGVALPGGCVVRAVDGAQAERFGAAAREAFWSGRFAVTQQCDRMGVRLSGTRVESPEGGRMTSEGVMWGAVQVPEGRGGGEPIVLMCDHPTTGGYPVIAAVAAVDLPVLGQLRPGDSVRFERVDRATALGLLRERERELDVALTPIVASGRAMDLNCDLGESEDPAQIAVDGALLRIVTSANIACGGHAGDAASMERTVRECIARGVAIGAHPSYPDRANFGRIEVAMSAEQIERAVGEQVRALAVVAARCGGRVVHVKPHGALYHAAMRREEVARAIGRAVLAIDALLVMVGQAGARGLAVWSEMGLRTAAEAFADRVYEADGSLRSRADRGALITDPMPAARQAVRIALDDSVVAADGSVVSVVARTLCIHSDTPNAPAVAGAVRRTLEQGLVPLRSPA